MKKLLICAALAMAMGAAVAAPISAEVTTTGPEGEASGYINRYSAYLCTVDAAEKYFSGYTTVNDVTDWLKDNYVTGIDSLKGAGDGVAMGSYGFDDGEYSFTKYVQSGVMGDYLAVVTYSGEGDPWFRVFGAAADGDGNVTMDPDANRGTAGAWTQAVPEPTSGLLLLLGVAGLALKRKRA